MTARAFRPVLTALALVVAVASVARSATAQARLRSEVDTTTITVGDPIELTVRVQHGADETVVWPDSVDVRPFELLGARVSPMTASGDGAVSSGVFNLTAFELGELEIPSFEVTVLHPDGSSEELETDRFGIEVVSVGVDESGDIREIRGPLAIPISAVSLALWSLLFTALGAALFAGFRKWRARHRPATREGGPPLRPAHELALEALDRLATSPMLERGEVKEYHIEVSEILRTYVEARFRVPALEMTTWEVMEGLERAHAGADVSDRLRRFLDQCDLVKFAKVRPGPDASRAVLALGRDIVEATIPVAAASAPEVGATPRAAADRRGVDGGRAPAEPETGSPEPGEPGIPVESV